MYNNHFAVQEKPTDHCKSTIRQLKKKVLKNSLGNNSALLDRLTAYESLGSDLHRCLAENLTECSAHYQIMMGMEGCLL